MLDRPVKHNRVRGEVIVLVTEHNTITNYQVVLVVDERDARVNSL